MQRTRSTLWILDEGGSIFVFPPTRPWVISLVTSPSGGVTMRSFRFLIVFDSNEARD